MKIVVDGNDGTGKSTLVVALRKFGYEVSDRGLPTKMTDSEGHNAVPDEFYLILDAPVETCRARLRAAGRDLNERYHTIEDLTHYRERFLQVAASLTSCVVMSAEASPNEVFKHAVDELRRCGMVPLTETYETAPGAVELSE